MTHPFERERKHTRDEAKDELRGPAAGGDHAALTTKPGNEGALRQIAQVLAGKAPEDQLPELLSVLDEDERNAFRPDAKWKLFKKVSGDIALRCAEIIDASTTDALKVALHAKSAVSSGVLHRYLAHRAGNELATLDEATLKTLREQLPARLVDAIPTITEKVDDLADNPTMLRWFVETTEHGVCAQAMARRMNAFLAAALDKHHLWTPWVDKLQASHVTPELAAIVVKVRDPHASAAIGKLVGGRAGMGRDELEADRKTHGGELHAELSGKPTVQSLLAAAGNEGGVAAADLGRLLDAMKRLQATADDVLALSNISGLDRARTITLLMHSDGVTSHHLIAFLQQDGGGLDVLADPKIRKAVRDKAPTVTLQDLLALVVEDAFHDKIVKNDGLAAWFLETAQPRDLLWFCSQNPANAARATRMARDKRGVDWVRQLTSLPEGKDKSLRILARNLHDKPSEEFIRHVLLGEHENTDVVANKTSVAVDDESRQGEGGRLVDALEGTQDELLLRLGDLDEAKRGKLGQNQQIAISIGSKLHPDQFYRGARFLDMTFETAIKASPGVSSATVGYLDRRPYAEQIAALAQPDLVKLAAEKVHPNLLVVFPALREPPKLAAALARDSNLLGLLLDGSDAELIIELISKEPVLSQAEKVVSKYPKVAQKLPRYKDMSGEARAGVDRLAKHAPSDSQASYAFDDVKTGETVPEVTAKVRGKRLHSVAKLSLVEAIETLGEKHEKKESEIRDEKTWIEERDALADEQETASVDALSLLRQRRAEVPALLTDRTQMAHVTKLAAQIDLPPNVAIPWIARGDLIAMPNALRWWLQFRDPTLVLHDLASNAVVRARVAGDAASNVGGALEWLQRLPKGGRLDTAEEMILDQMRPLMRESTALGALFHARFGFPAPAAYDVGTLNELYAIISRLPPGHIQQERIQMITNPDLDPNTGMYGEGAGNVMIDDEVTPGSGTDELYSPEMTGWYSAADMKKKYGYDDAKLDQLKAEDRIELKIKDGAFQYRLKVQTMDLFTQVVLHEIGHSVDEMLGKRTSPVFDFAAWHEYTDATFDQWASEMGGWDKVSADHKKQIRDVWIDATRGKTKVKELVPADHPALSSAYEREGVGIVKNARAGETFDYKRRTQIGDRVFVAGSYDNEWSSVKASAVETAPSIYSIHAPAEYFAESYVEYYRGVDGTPGSHAKKGGALASTVKQWFDANVDKIKFDPARFKGGASDKGDDDVPRQAAAAKDGAQAAKTKKT